MHATMVMRTCFSAAKRVYVNVESIAIDCADLRQDASPGVATKCVMAKASDAIVR